MVFKKLNGFFHVRKNIILRRQSLIVAVISSERPQINLSCHSTTLLTIGLKDEMIRYRLVVGIRDTAFSEKLQMNADLMLNKLTVHYLKTWHS